MADKEKYPDYDEGKEGHINYKHPKRSSWNDKPYKGYKGRTFAGTEFANAKGDSSAVPHTKVGTETINSEPSRKKRLGKSETASGPKSRDFKFLKHTTSSK